VVFTPAADLRQTVAEPMDQLLVFARDRNSAAALASSASRLAAEHGLSYESRQEQPSYNALQQDVRAVGDFANLLPRVFLAAAVLG
jgi:putative ABC transport system permease protein